MTRKAKVLCQTNKNSEKENLNTKPLSKRAEISKNKQRKNHYKELGRKQKKAIEKLLLEEAQRNEREARISMMSTKPAATNPATRKSKQPVITHSPKPTNKEEAPPFFSQQTPNEQKKSLAALPNIKENPEAVRAYTRSLKPQVSPDPKRYHPPTSINTPHT